jgi:immunity protein Imm5 of predicted polymorphic toxin system
MSDDLDRAIREGLSALEAAEDGWLDLPDRRRLREAFGPWTPPSEPGGPDLGLLRRAALKVACAQRAFPAWERRFPADRRPLELIEAVMPALRGELPEERVDELGRALREDVEPLGVASGDDGGSFFAGSAAVHLTWEAWDGDLDPELDPPDTRDRDLDEPQVEALACWALAGEDADARRDYWRWYVTEAFPAAYAVSA